MFLGFLTFKAVTCLSALRPVVARVTFIYFLSFEGLRRTTYSDKLGGLLSHQPGHDTSS